MAANDKQFRFPNNTERTMIFGDTGGGKTQFGAFLLSKQNLRNHVWIITDYKDDELLNSIERTREIGYNDTPTKPGLYIIHPRPDEDDEMEKWLWKIWEQGETGLYVDEGALIPNAKSKGAMASLQIQGRSKHIPIITLSQRSVDISRYSTSQASHVIAFPQNDEREIAVLKTMVPSDFPTWIPASFGNKKELPEYWSRWYCIKTRQRYVLRPVPKAQQIRANIDAQLEPKVSWV